MSDTEPEPFIKKSDLPKFDIDGDGEDDVGLIYDKVVGFGKDLDAIPEVHKFSEATGIPALVVGAVVVITGGLVLVFNFPYQEVTIAILGTLYPCYKSI